MKRVLITAGQVYGKLDDNKLVGNRVRGIWAIKFADWLLAANRDCQIDLVIPDTMPKENLESISPFLWGRKRLNVIRHNGFHSYREICLEKAKEVDAAVMAAAVVNWIPEKPFVGKMPTTETRMDIPFILAPRVINEMKKINPKLTLIGCKMLIGSTYEDLIEAAYSTLIASKSNLMIANDMGNGLKKKYLVFQDRSVIECNDDFGMFYSHIAATIDDKHYKTFPETHYIEAPQDLPRGFEEACKLFDKIVDENRNRFFKPLNGKDMVFGSVLVSCPINPDNPEDGRGWIVSPREKGELFSSKDAAYVTNIDFENGNIWTNPNRITKSSKASLNAPLLIRVAMKYGAKAILHLHEQLPSPPSITTVEYAPPGTFRDNNRENIYRCFNIKHHGFIQCLEHNNA